VFTALLYDAAYNGEVKRLLLIATATLPAVALIIALASRGAGSAQAEITTPGPTPTPPAMSAGLVSTGPSGAPGLTSLGPPPRPPGQARDINVCNLGAEFHHGGDETLVLPNFALDLPPGDYMVGTVTRANVSSVEVCYRPDASVLKLHDVSGGELGRLARSGDAHVAFDAIVASVRPPFDLSRGVRVPTLTTVAP
jgi:hypothetical protein